MSRYLRIEKFAAETGYTPKAIRRKIETGVWIEGVQYRRAPDGRILVCMEAFEAWVEGSRSIAARSA